MATEKKFQSPLGACLKKLILDPVECSKPHLTAVQLFWTHAFEMWNNGNIFEFNTKKA